MYFTRMLMGKSSAFIAVRKHFRGTPVEQVLTAKRTFPLTSRVDVERAVKDACPEDRARLLGVHSQFDHETLSLAHLMTRSPMPLEVGPLQYDEIDVGEEQPVRCLKTGLWLTHEDGLRFAVLMTPAVMGGVANGVQVEIAVAGGERGLQLSTTFMQDIETRAAAGKTYRGRVLSLDYGTQYSGRGGAVRVHRLHPVKREEVILPESTLQLLERNITGFVAMRDRLRRMGLPARKGVLFHGKPGTGKTHTIHYLAPPSDGALEGSAVQEALQDMLFRGGSLNVSLLGGAVDELVPQGE